MNLTRERVFRLNLSPYLSYATGWTMRIWRTEDMNSGTHYEPQRTVIDRDIGSRVQQFVNNPVTQLDLARAILELDRVTAVEIVDAVGSGEKLTKGKP